MKKYIVLIILAVGLQPLFAKQKLTTSIKATYEFGVDYAKNQGFGLDIIERYNITNNFSVGIGTGFYYCDLLFDDGGHEYDNSNLYSREYRESGAYLPLFLNLKLNLTNEGISPYLSLGGGYTFLIPFSEYAKKADLGVMIRPAFGIDIPISPGSLFVEFGYKYQKMNFNGYGLTYDLNHSNLTISLGYNF